MKIVLVSHGTMCIGMKDSFEMIAGNNPNIHCVSLNEGIHEFKNNFLNLMDQICPNEQVLIFSDIQGGTPFNEVYAYYLENPNSLRLIAGMNLPMLIEVALQMDNLSLDEAYTLALTTGKEAVTGISLNNEEVEDELEF